MVRLTVRNRIFAIILGLGTVIFALFMAVTYYQTSRALKENIGEDFQRLAQQMAARIDLSLQKEVAEWTHFAHQRDLIKAIEQANRRYRGLSPEVIRSEFDRIDREWPFSEAFRHLYTPSLNPTALLLTRHQALDPEEYAETFVTDVKGALVAATNRTTDYWQADEGWWQTAFNKGRGAVYVSGVEFDDSANVYSISFALPIKSLDKTQAIGVLKVVINIHDLMKSFAEYRLGRTGHVHVLDSSGLDIFRFVGMSGRLPYLLRPGMIEDIRPSSLGHLVSSDAWGKKFIAGFAPVVPEKRLGPDTFDGKQWYVLVTQDLDEAYASINRLVGTLLSLGILFLVAIYLTALLTARTITTPLDEIRRGTQIVRDGDLAHRVKLATGDELQELAESFNEMTARLQTSHEELEDRVRERKRAEEELSQSHEELRKTHEALRKSFESMELTQAQLVASEKLAAVGRLTAGVSHEILNPLNIITLSLQLMIEDPDSHPATTEQLQVLEDQAHRIAKITQNLLYFSRQTEPERRQVDLGEIVTQTLGLLERELTLDNIELDLNLAERLPPVSADQHQLQQVVLNLLTNARDAMPKGGRLSLSTEAVQTDGRKFVELRVEDTGPGIAPGHLNKLFDPFFTTKDEGEGTGLGLSICQGIIEAHGGSIRAENGPEGGAAFVVRLVLDEG